MSVLGSLYSLPADFFSAAWHLGAKKGLDDLTSSTPAQAPPVSTPIPAEGVTAGTSGISKWSDGATCQACGIGINSPGFQSAAEQRVHFKTDWHRYNVKRRLAKQPPMNEADFEAMLDNESEVSSISGSSSEEEDEEDEGGAGPGRQQRGGAGSGQPPQSLFEGPEGKQFCVWTCLLEKDHVRGHDEGSAGKQLTELQRLRKAPGLFVVLLVRGGHFAAAVFKAKQAAGAKAAQGSASDLFDVVAHKTFHRYVVRAKAGGRQSSKDATGKFAKSAGSALRRYNEAALDNDILELLVSWKDHLQAADLIFVQAPSSNARSVFLSSSEQAAPGPKAGLLNPNDPRVRRIPFSTQRPTFSEARRAVGLLTAVFEPNAAALAAQQAADEAAAAAVQQKEERAQQKLAAKQQRKVQGEAAGSGSAGREQGNAAPAPVEIKEPLLHVASRTGSVEKVTELLGNGADPCARDARGRTAYGVAGSKEVRDAFRRAMAAAPDRWDWGAAEVPSALTEDLEAAQAAKKAEKKARQKARDAERKAGGDERKKVAEAAAKAAMEDEIAKAAAEAAALAAKMSNTSGKGGKKVGGAGGSAAAGSASKGKQTPAQAPLTPEEQARRREMMAAAAEARMKALNAAMTQQKLY